MESFCQWSYGLNPLMCSYLGPRSGPSHQRSFSILANKHKSNSVSPLYGLYFSHSDAMFIGRGSLFYSCAGFRLPNDAQGTRRTHVTQYYSFWCHLHCKLFTLLQRCQSCGKDTANSSYCCHLTIKHPPSEAEQEWLVLRITGTEKNLVMIMLNGGFLKSW